MNLFRALLVCLVIGFSSVASASEKFYWTIPFPDEQVRYDGYIQACQANTNHYAGITGGSVVDTRIDVLSETETRCQVQILMPNQLKNWYGNVATRRGDSCPADTEYNPATGECEGPEPNICEEKAGQTELFAKSGTAPDEFMFISSDGKLFEPRASDACMSGCRASVAVDRCVVRVSGIYACKGEATFTGAECTEGGGTSGDGDTNLPPIEGTDTPDLPPPTKDNEHKPCVYEVRPDGSKGCVSTTIIEEEGLSCGTANGATVCTSTPPKKDDLTVDTTVRETPNSDGGTTTTKRDEATLVTCVGANCKTSTTTSTTTTTTNSNGDTTSTTGSCQGELCADKNSNPDGNGDGFGDCIGSGCGSGSGFEGEGFEEVATFGESLTGFSDRVAAAPIFQGIGSLGISGSGSCGFGSVQTDIGTISLDGMCTNSHWLEGLYYVFLAIWAFVAVRVLISA